MRASSALDIAAAAMAAAGVASVVTLRWVLPGAALSSVAGLQLLGRIVVLASLTAAVTWLAPGLLARSGLVGRAVQGAVRAALRPVWFGLGLPLLAWPLNAIVFHDVSPLLLGTGLALGGLASMWRLRAVAAIPAPRLLVVLLTVATGTVMALGWPPPQGDEPHYLIVAHSIVVDGDLDVANDYGDRVFASFHPEYLSPHYKPGLRAGSRYSMHGVGYAAFLAPAYALGRLISPYWAVALPRLQQVAVNGLFAWLVLSLVSELLAPVGGFRSAALLTMTAPLLFAPLHLFPESPAMTLAAAAFLLLSRDGTARALFAGTCLALVPWLGVKYIPLALTVGVTGAFLRRFEARRLLAVLLPVAATLAAHAVFTWTLYGSVSPSSIYIGSDPGFSRQSGYGSDWVAYLADWPAALRTLLGYFLDQKEGLLAVAPHYVLGIAGAVVIWRRDRRLLLALALIVAAHLGPYALSQQLGGQSPPARPLMGVLWVLAVPLAAILSVSLPRIGAWLRGGLLMAGAALSAAFAWDPSLLPHDYGVRAAWALRAWAPNGAELWRWFPSWVNVVEVPWGVNMVWLAGTALLIGQLARDASGSEVPSGSRPPCRNGWIAATVVLAAVLLLGVVIASFAVTDRHQGTSIAPGVDAWVISSRPQTSWAEAGGVWSAPAAAREVVLTAAEPIGSARVTARSLIENRVWASCGDWARAFDLPAGPSVEMDADLGAGRAWRGGRAYRCRIEARQGVPPAAVDSGEDWRHLGVLVGLARVERGVS